MTLDEKLEAAANDMYGVADALDRLSDVRDCDDIKAILHDKLNALSIEFALVHAEVEARDQRDLDDLRREYERATA